MPRFGYLNCVVAVLSFGLITTSAFADTTELFCQELGMNQNVGLYLSIDPNASTVAAWYTGFSRDSVAADSATITADQVTWDSSSAVQTNFTLDRGTGALIGNPANGSQRRFTCVKASKVF